MAEAQPLERPLRVHEETYRRGHPAWRIHRARLEAIESLLRRHLPDAVESWADFGCSNGFIIDRFLSGGVVRASRVTGYDHSEELLELARARGIERARFEACDLNQPAAGDAPRYDLVTCFEVLEHVGDYRTSATVIANHVAPGGLLAMAVPNETGLPGLAKLVGRRLLRRKPYDDFFRRASVARYVFALLAGRSTEGFREPGRSGYGPHLGFDYRALRSFVHDEFVRNGAFEAVDERRTPFSMNVLMAFRRTR